ncbi:MAG: tryptophan 7-halogenase [Acidimicrobiia bacterium]|nr:tryptophan 7-halogenase [Acidimicrobiia bacterium]
MGSVVVIGGGPGGSTAATMVARTGHRVLLLEREQFPRAHIGESLLPASMPILEELGVADAVAAAGFEKKWGATMVWGRTPGPWSWYFAETNTTHPHAYQVWRPTFDALLLDNSRAAGVEVREQARVTEVLTEGESVVGVRWVDESGGAHEERPDLVIDASGQAALVGHALRLRRYDPAFRNMAVYAYFDGATRLPDPDATNILVESYPDGWLWVIPLHNGLVSVGAVVDIDVARPRLRGDALEPFLRHEIAESELAAKLLAGASKVDGPFGIRDWSYTSDRLVGDGYVLVGDAACFVDPLFSSGVHLALTSGLLAAAYAVTLFDDPELGAAAAPVYQELYQGQYDRFHQLAQLFYASNTTIDSYFWEARRMLGGLDRGDSVGAEPSRGRAEHAARLEFIRAVAGQPPQGYERVVLDRGQLPEEVAHLLDAAAAELRGRRDEVARLGPALLNAVPHLAPGAAVERRPVLDRGRFEWGTVLVSDHRREAVPVGRVVTALVGAIDGNRTVSGVVAQIGASLGLDHERLEALAPSLRAALETLYADGVIASFG